MSGPISQNVAWTIEQVALFLAEAKDKPRKHRSRYYKASFLLTASIVEAFVFLIIKNYCASHRVEYRTEFSYKCIHNFPDQMFQNISSGSKVGIFERKKNPFLWKDNLDFYSLNNIGQKYGIFTPRLFKKLEKIRIRRNAIHLQSLRKKDHRYSMKDIEYAGSVLPQLIDIS